MNSKTLLAVVALGMLAAPLAQAGEGKACDWAKKDGGSWHCKFSKKSTLTKLETSGDCGKLKATVARADAAVPACPEAGCWLEIARTLAGKVSLALAEGEKGLLVALLTEIQKEMPEVVGLGSTDTGFNHKEWKNLGTFEGLDVLIQKKDGETLAFLVPSSKDDTGKAAVWIAVSPKTQTAKS